MTGVGKMEQEHKRSGLMWVDKHRSTNLAKLEVHKALNVRLLNLVRQGDVPHLFFYGPPGAGKRTRVMGVLHELFGASAEKLRVQHRVFKLGDPPKEVEMTLVMSNHHVEMNPSDVGIKDRLVVQEMIKEIASSVPLDAFQTTKKKEQNAAGPEPQGAAAAGANTSNNSAAHKPAFKVLVLHDVDRMSRLAQQALRRTMEKYARTCRIIMLATSASKVIEPLRSRCLGVRVPLPSDTELVQVLRHVANKEGFIVTDSFGAKVVASSGRNMRRALLQLEASKSQNYPFSAEQQVTKADWELACASISDLMLVQQAPRTLLTVRQKLYDLLTHAIPADIIFHAIVANLLRQVDQELAPQLVAHAAMYEHRMQKGSKPILHLEAFCARFMQLYKAYLSAIMDLF
ncbi:Replication factor C subunit 3 [Porphyridium purpureum]|uniref:Replication factor C subunit 3 n=1 Tax=Porphyridium purpureum TaxID=35688 RepID=A0A5J4YYK4_PORPP|nr:Replication factor C subunit 3 [Porphyridium purpureum]|eukprot:POR3730..scf208_2